MRFLPSAALLMAVAASVHGATPTQVDLRTQTKSVDFSGANSTRPLKSGTSLPGTCNPGDMYFKTDAPAGSNIYGCVGLNTWSMQGGTGGGNPSGGATMASELGDLQVSMSNGNLLNVGPNCSANTPCNVRFGSVAYSFSTGASAALTAGTGDAYVYVANGGVLTVGHNLTLNCSACTAQAGVTGFPLDAIPVSHWHATNGAWDSGQDVRASTVTKNVAVGAGLSSLEETTGRTTISADPTIIGLRVSAPSSSGAACAAGNWAMDSTYYYLCVSQNSWRRVQLNSW